MERKNAWSQYSAEELSRLEAVNEDYKACLDAGKTERECVELSVNVYVLRLKELKKKGIRT